MGEELSEGLQIALPDETSGPIYITGKDITFLQGCFLYLSNSFGWTGKDSTWN